jgi:hypothetical protein
MVRRPIETEPVQGSPFVGDDSSRGGGADRFVGDTILCALQRRLNAVLEDPAVLYSV